MRHLLEKIYSILATVILTSRFDINSSRNNKMAAISCKGIYTCKANTPKESCSGSIANRQSFKVMFIVGIMTCILAIFVTPVDSTISTSSRKTATDMISRKFVLQRGGVASAASGVSSTRRRLVRRPVVGQEYLELRRYLHQLRQQRQGAKAYSRGNVRRHALLERSFHDNSLTKDLNCGQCKLKKMWVPVSKPGCRTNYVLASVCAGLCETWEIPGIQYNTKRHNVCRPVQQESRKINLQRCNPGVNTQYVITMAKSCACMKCRGTDTSCRTM